MGARRVMRVDLGAAPLRQQRAGVADQRAGAVAAVVRGDGIPMRQLRQPADTGCTMSATATAPCRSNRYASQQQAELGRG